MCSVRIHPPQVRACRADGGSFMTLLPTKGRGLLFFEISIHWFENEKLTKDTNDSTDPLIQSQSELQSSGKCWGHFDTPSTNEKIISASPLTSCVPLIKLWTSLCLSFFKDHMVIIIISRFSLSIGGN